MGMFITKFSKEGKGVPKDAPEKRRFFLFFELLFGKFKKLVQLNLLYFATLIPLFVGLYFSVSVNPDIYQGTKSIFQAPIFTLTPDIISLIILLIAAIITGPATAGFTFVLRNLQRREHAWIWSDFFEQFKKNFKQGVAMSFLDLIVYTLLYVAFAFYLFIMPIQAPEAGKILPTIGSVLVITVFILYTWAHFYIYTMMVTFDLKFDKLFKNALIFAAGKLPLNLLVSVILIALFVLCLLGVIYIPIVVVLLSLLLLPSLFGFVTVFSTYPTIDKYMLQKVKNSKRILNDRDE